VIVNLHTISNIIEDFVYILSLRYKDHPKHGFEITHANGIYNLGLQKLSSMSVDNQMINIYHDKTTQTIGNDINIRDFIVSNYVGVLIEDGEIDIEKIHTYFDSTEFTNKQPNVKERNTKKVLLLPSPIYKLGKASSIDVGVGTLLNGLYYVLDQANILYDTYFIQEVNRTWDQLTVKLINFDSYSAVLFLTANGLQNNEGGNGEGVNVELMKYINTVFNGRIILLSSFHLSEYRLYAKTDPALFKKIQCYAFHKTAQEELVKMSLSKDANPFPIIITKLPQSKSINNTNDVKLLLQYDKQFRKFGQQSLLMTIDAANKALEINPDLNVNIYAKSTAWGSFTNANFINSVIRNVYKNIHKNITIHFLTYQSYDHWKTMMDSIDIGITISTEEGLGYFPIELWLNGSHIVYTSPGPMDMYDMLPHRNIPITSFLANAAGQGIFNDGSDAMTYIPDYNSFTEKVSHAILYSRKQISEVAFPTIVNNIKRIKEILYG